MAARARFFAPVALAALSAIAALSLGRLVDSSRFVVPVLAAAVLPHVVGLVARRMPKPGLATVVLSVGGLALFVLWAREGTTTAFGIPSADTWHALEQQLSGGWHLLRTAPAPAPATDGAILLAVLGVWCMAAIADWLAFRLQATLGAIAPALVFFVWTSTLGTDAARLLLTGAFCGAACTFLVVQNLAVLERRRNWLVSPSAVRIHWLLPAAVLGVSAVVVALLVAPVLPGAGSQPLLDFSTTGRDAGHGHSYVPGVLPFVDIGAKLDQVENQELFTVRAAVPDYWRIAALDTYSGDNGGQWTLRAAGAGSVEVGLPTEPPAGALVQQFHIGALRERWLPAAYRPVAINLPNTLVVRSSGTIVSDAPSISRLEYTVASELPVLAGAVDATADAATRVRVPARLRDYTALPDDAAIDTIRAEAQRVTAGASTPYEQAELLRDSFRDPASGYVYDTSVDPVDSGSAIVAFLRDKRGFCVQFASAYAVMARALGIPARVAVGFTPGTQAPDGTYHVSSHDAHAWPEIWLAGFGWTHMFDPTPPGSGSITGGSHLPDEAPVGASSTTPNQTVTTPATTVAPAGSADGGGATNGPNAPSNAAPASPAVSAESGGGGWDAWLPAVLALGVLLVLVGGYVTAVLVAKARRRARRRDARDPAAAITGAWQEALDRLHEADVAWDPALTPMELAREAPRHTTPGSASPMHRLAGTYTAARYGGAANDDDARAAWTSVDELERALTGDLTWHRRWRRRVDAKTLRR
jgi:transglutaminase-like putative cysteine protease